MVVLGEINIQGRSIDLKNTIVQCQLSHFCIKRKFPD